ncbi:MAG: metallophosphoesterase [Paludibacteraceae bacterium]|nr:metallophosphoesterase [Paludibacteraceae bacterium]
MKKKVLISLTLLVVFGIVLTIERYDAWFKNLPEPAYSITSPQNHVLTYESDTSLVMTWRDAGTTFQSSGGTASFHKRTFSTPSSICRRILVLGDIQDPDDEQAFVTQSIIKEIVNRHHPQAILQLGDLIERPMQCAWDRFSIAFDSIDTVIPIIPILGNHDYLKGLIHKPERRPFLVFPYLKQTNIAACAHLTLCPDTLDIFIVDSNRDVFNLFNQGLWLENELKKSSAKFKILLSHHPLYTTRFPLNNLFVRMAFSSVAADNGVSLVLSGHEHTYSHTFHTFHQIVSHFSSKSYDKSDSRYYTILEIDGNALKTSVFDKSNSLVESFSIISEK